MAKKDGFDFDTGQKSGLNLNFLKNLTKKQKEIILITAIVLIVVAIVAAAAVLIVSTGNAGNNGGVSGGGGIGNVGGNGGSGSGEGNDSTDGTITSIILATNPLKTSYYVGDKPDYSGLQIFLNGKDLEAEYVHYDRAPEDFTITGFDSSVPTSEQAITVEYKGFTTSFTVKILEIPLAPPTLVGIRLDPAPRDTAKAGVALSVKNAYIICEYSDGSEKSIKLAHNHLYGYENELTNAQVGDVITVYVRYTEDGYIAETSYTVTVIE